MKKTMLTFSLFCMLGLNGCDQSRSSTAPDNMPSTDRAATQPSTKIPDWIADYKGFIACEDCEKILVSLQLNKDHSYTLKEVYFFKQRIKQKQSTGTFTVDPHDSNIVQLLNGKNKNMRYLSIHPQQVEFLDHHKHSFLEASKYKIAAIQNIEVNNALKYVDIQADLSSTEDVLLNNIPSTQLTYFFEVNNHAEHALKLRNSDIVLVDQHNNEHKASIQDSPIAPIASNTTQYLLVSFTYPKANTAAYINIK